MTRSTRTSPLCRSLGRLALALLLAAPLAASLEALQTGARPAGQESGSGDEVQRLSAWPELEPGAEAQLTKDVARLRKANTEAMGVEAHDALVEFGAAAAPALIFALGKERKAEGRARVVAVLDRITGAAHTRLLAREFADRSEAVRTWTLARAARFPDPGIRAEAEAAWKDVLARAGKKKASDEEQDAAALALTSSGSVAALDRLLARAGEVWKDLRDEVYLAAGGARGPEATRHVLAWLEGKDAQGVIAGLRVLAGCGDRELAPTSIRPYLDTEHAQVRVAAINALRVIVDGEPPLERLSAFDAIERAKRWKARL